MCMESALFGTLHKKEKRMAKKCNYREYNKALAWNLTQRTIILDLFFCIHKLAELVFFLQLHLHLHFVAKLMRSQNVHWVYGNDTNVSIKVFKFSSLLCYTIIPEELLMQALGQI